MAERSRLDAYQDIAAAMRRAGAELQARAARAAAEWAIAQTGLSHPAVVAALEGGPPEPVAVLAADLDERYFRVSEARDAGEATTEEVVAAFGLARAANAAEFVACGEPMEAIYEAIATAEDWSELRQLLQALLPRK